MHKRVKMKSKKIITIVIFLMSFTLNNAYAQRSSLTYQDLFEGKVVPKKEMMLTEVRGDKLRSLGLDSFKSVRFSADSQRLMQVGTIISNAVAQSVESDTESFGGVLTYALIYLGGTEKKTYMGYQVNGDSGRYEITVLLFSGKTTVEELKEKFIRKKSNK